MRKCYIVPGANSQAEQYARVLNQVQEVEFEPVAVHIDWGHTNGSGKSSFIDLSRQVKRQVAHANKGDAVLCFSYGAVASFLDTNPKLDYLFCSLTNVFDIKRRKVYDHVTKPVSMAWDEMDSVNLEDILKRERARWVFLCGEKESEDYRAVSRNLAHRSQSMILEVAQAVHDIESGLYPETIRSELLKLKF